MSSRWVGGNLLKLLLDPVVAVRYLGPAFELQKSISMYENPLMKLQNQKKQTARHHSSPKQTRWVGGLVFFLLLSMVPNVSAKKVVLERIMAVVNNDIILWSEWKQRYGLLLPRLRQILDADERKAKAKELRKQVLDGMISELLLQQRATQLQIDVTDKEVKLAMEDTRNRYRLSPQQFKEAIQQQGFTATSYKTMVRRQLRQLKLQQRELQRKIQVSEEEIRAFYKKTTKSVEAGPPEFYIRHIVFLTPKDATAEKIADAKRQAENVLKLVLQKPAEFQTLAKRFSQGPSAKKGGSLGFLKKGDIHENIEAVMLKMKKGVHESVIRSPMGFHILELVSKRSSGVLSYKEARPNILARLRNKAFARELKRYVKGLRKQALIEVRDKL